MDVASHLSSASSADGLPSDGAPFVPTGSALAQGSRREVENHLAQVRLGMASSLFTALRMKHADTASHSLRVSLNSAAWMVSLGMDPGQRDIMEVAALLHDVGKIGVPDSILLKPGSLSGDEARIMDQHRQHGVEILRNSCDSHAILRIVASYAAWYDGSNRRVPLAGDEIPLGARMLTICDAYDAMTSDQVYRRALPREAALSELFRFAGSQFDPQLVQLFAKLQTSNPDGFMAQAARQWLQALAPEQVNSLWRLNIAPSEPAALIPEDRFRERLLDNMRDAVFFVDSSLRILSWNTGAERMTGIAATSLFQRPFKPALLHMRTDDHRPVRDDECPVLGAIASGEMRHRRLLIRGRGGHDLSVEAQVVPVTENDGTLCGAAVLLHDVSPEISLEARCQSLHEAATKDPLTRVANRAEFNRVHQMFVMAHLERQLPCSLIIADIDHFKQVNDTYGHQAGDEVLKAFAALLRAACRPGDLVARYGGEEFVVLCADCDNAAAARRAEGMRRALAQSPQPALGGHTATCSFGVTEIQGGDTPDTMLKRADRALYEAKEGGRNRVVQLGTGLRRAAAVDLATQTSAASKVLLEQGLSAPVPVSLVVEKLRGFVADHQAEVVSAEDGEVRLSFSGSTSIFRRHADRRVPLCMELSFKEAAEETPREDSPMRYQGNKTQIQVRILLQRARDRRHADGLERARQLFVSLKCYLMATEEKGSPDDSSSDQPG